jgi:hypothetical protein
MPLLQSSPLGLVEHGLVVDCVQKALAKVGCRDRRELLAGAHYLMRARRSCRQGRQTLGSRPVQSLDWLQCKRLAAVKAFCLGTSLLPCSAGFGCRVLHNYSIACSNPCHANRSRASHKPEHPSWTP